jgi:hypothetical protein
MSDVSDNLQPEVDEHRRRVLKLAKYGAYTAPILMGMLAAEKAVAATGPAGCPEEFPEGEVCFEP